MARQIVLQNNKLEVRCKMYLDLKKYIVNFASDDSVRTTVTKADKTALDEQQERKTVIRPGAKLGAELH